MRSLRELLEDLGARGRVPEETAESVALQLAQRQSAREGHAMDDEAPWYLIGLTGLGAWAATIFFLLGMGLMVGWGGTWQEWASGAAVLLALGLGVRRLSGHVFVQQLSFGLCLAGWVAGCFAGGEGFDSFGAVAATGLLLVALVYPLHPDAGPRFLISGAAATIASAWFIFELDEQVLLGHNLPPLASGLVAGFLLARADTARALLPLGYALALVAGVVIPLMEADLGQRPVAVSWWPAALGLGAGLAVLVVHALRPVEASLRREILPACLGALALLGGACLVGGPGLLIAIGLLVLGHASARRPLEVLGALALPVHLFLYYRDLDVSLLAKSGSVIASGVVLLLLRWLLGRRPWARAAR